MKDVFVGLDVSKDGLDVHVRPSEIGFSVGSDWIGYGGLIARPQLRRAKRIVLEATGGYERALWLALSEAGRHAGANARAMLRKSRLSGILISGAAGRRRRQHLTAHHSRVPSGS